MKYDLETIVVTEDVRRFTDFSPYSAWHYVKENNGTVFFRCKALRIEVKMVYVGGQITEMRTKYNRKVVENSYDIPDWDFFMSLYFDFLRFQSTFPLRHNS